MLDYLFITIIRATVKMLSKIKLRFENTPLNGHVKIDRMSNLLENRLYTQQDTAGTATSPTAVYKPTHFTFIM